MKTENIREVALEEIVDLPVHPVADIFPMLATNSSEREAGKVDKQTITLAELADSIIEYGLQEPIVLFDSENGKMLLDGRNRRQACILGKVETVLVEDFIGTEEEAETYVLNLNIDRRDLTPGQRAFAAAKFWEMESEKARVRMLSTLKKGEEPPATSNLTERNSGETRQLLASRFRVSNSYVNAAHKEIEAIEAARLKAEDLQRKADELASKEKEAEAKIEIAKASGNKEAIREAVTEKAKAADVKTDLREQAAKAAEDASVRERKASRVQRGESFNSVYGDKKKGEEVTDDPVGKLRTRINSSFTNLRQAVSELAQTSGQGVDDYNFVGRKISDFVKHFEDEFGVSSE